MAIFNDTFKNITILLICLFFICQTTVFAESQLSLTQEERDYISNRAIVKATSIEGAAPLHYTDSKGQIRGIAINILDEISDMTGLTFHYKLYDSIDKIPQASSDILFGATRNYVSDDVILSYPYLKSETVLFINSSLESDNLEDKIYAAMKGGSLPEGIKEENAVYYNNREETLDAVEKGDADYSYGNAYSLAFYTLQNAYKNIITIPQGKEVREYCIGFPREDELLLSIINKSIKAIDESRMQSLILDATSQVDREVTLPMILAVYGWQIFAIFIAVISILLYSIIYNIRINRQLNIRNKKNDILHQISNEYLYEYHVRTNKLDLCEKCIKTFGAQDEFSRVGLIIRNTLSKRNLEKGYLTMELPLANGGQGIFKMISSVIHDDKGNVDSIVGKLIDITEEMEEKEELITKAQLDGLTALYNASTSKKLITERISKKNKYDMDAFILIDCDKFKRINDSFGHLTGDKVLANIGHALKLTFRKTDIIGRVGGDEFCIYMKNLPTVSFVRTKSQQLSKLIQNLNEEYNITVSIGIALLDMETTYDELFKKADDALYEVKRRGGAQIVVYNDRYKR